MESKKKWEPCSPGCPGWAFFDEGTDECAIAACDSCGRFESDGEAATFAARAIGSLVRYVVEATRGGSSGKSRTARLLRDGTSEGLLESVNLHEAKLTDGMPTRHADGQCRAHGDYDCGEC